VGGLGCRVGLFRFGGALLARPVSGTEEPVYAPLVAHNGFAHSWAWVDRTRAFILGDWDTPQFAGRFFWLSVGG
jgi:hypothetical protein